MYFLLIILLKFNKVSTMAHIHLPDGIMPLEWCALWFAVTAGILLVSFYMIKLKGASQRQVVLFALLTGLLFVIMQIPVPAPLGGTHLNFTPLAGILAGPWFGAIIVFLINVFSAAVGHGGVTVIGANTVVLFVEASLGFGIYVGLKRYLKRRDVSAGLATFTALIAGTLVAVAIITFSGGFQQFQTALVNFMGNPLIPIPQIFPHELEALGEMLLGWLLEPVFGPIMEINVYYAVFNAIIASTNSFVAFLAAMLPVNAGVGVIEAVVTGIIVETLAKTRPDILEESVIVEGPMD
jgi:cobalt/nickel transport system permease protein